MTLPFENDTNPIVKKISKRNLKADKSRNVLIIITIALATCLIMATALYFLGSQRKSLNDAMGRYQAVINDIDNDKIEKLVNDGRVDVGVSHLLGMVSYGDFKLTVRSMDKTLMDLAKYPDLQGKLPETEKEVAITKAFLERTGLSKSVGDNISIDLGDGKKEYNLCGILPVDNSNYSLFVSQSYVASKISDPTYSAYVRLKGSDGWSKAAIQSELLTLLNEWGIQQENIQFSTYYFSLIEQRSSQYMLIIAFVCLIVTLACTLVVYSLFYVSIVRKTNEYGKLRTIGTTGKQIKRIVFREGHYLAGIGIPMGLIAGGVAGYILVPKGWNALVTLIIAAVTALFMYSCIMFTIMKPAKIASRVTPMEAIHYTENNEKIAFDYTRKSKQPLTTNNLAFLNFLRNKKKTVLTILSLGVCGVLLMASSAYFNSIDPEEMARRSFPYGEIRLELGDYGPQSHNSEQYVELQKSNLLTDDFITSIKNIHGVQGVKAYQGTVLNVHVPTGDVEPIVSEVYSKKNQKIVEKYLIEGTADLSELIRNNGVVIANDLQWKEIFGWDVALGDEISLEVGGQKIQVKVMGIVDGNIPYGGYDTLFIPLEMLNTITPVENLNYQLIIDTADNEWDIVKEEIQKIVSSNACLYISTFNDWVEAYNEKLLNYRIPVYIFVMFIGVFGIINLLNTLITNVLTRKRELGVLQAVGLSGKQLSNMLLMEGVFYTICVLILSILFGTVIGYLLCTVFSSMSIFGRVAVEKLQQLLDKVKISEFKSQGIEKFDIEEFSQQYENLLKELQEKEVPNKIIFQEKQVELYKSIHNTYYHNEKPYHTVGELQSKEQYVAKLFNDNLSQQLSTEEARLRKLKRDYEEYKNKTKDMTDAIKVLVGKYEDANKEYQTQLLNAIKIPLMVYSGRIIQNYPLGLGIRAVIKTNQLVFEAASKSGSDVYNILSTGQLNGLSIALLLSIKNVYGDTKGLDILLIDDPLQTIDDISAISLADLLTQQGIGQIVLSTHEEAKAALLRYKFKHAGMSVREQNMQALYMKTVTEE